MITFELDQVEIDHCLQCGGIWLDGGELEMLLGNTKSAVDTLKSFKSAPKIEEKARKCPICMKKMLKVHVGNDENKVLIDACKRNDGLWFDKGELREVVKLAGSEAQTRIGSLLEEMFKDQLAEQKQSE
jgi:hypothetical protein